MELKEFSWLAFCDTGSVDAYLLYKEAEEEWTASRQEELSQGAENTEKQDVC